MPLVLVAEDDDDLCDLFRLVLEDEGFDVAVVQDGTEVLAVCRERAPDLLLLDLVLPGLGGVDVVRALRVEPALAKMPVLVVTGHDPATVLQQVRGSGGVLECLGKPFRPAELIHRVHQLLSTTGRP